MAKYLIVDAHSVIFAWPELRSVHGRRTVLGRDALIKLLTAYQDFSGMRVVAIFDGRAGKLNEDTAPGGIQVFYSAEGQTADAVVERLVAKYAREHDIIVATDDLLEQQTATSFGATAVSTHLLKQMLEETQTGLQRVLKRRKRDLGL